MGRPVGGASAVGCGVFGIGGLLVGVALVFWLGSQVLPSTGSDAPKDPETSTASSQVEDLGGIDLPEVDVVGMEPRGAAIAISPASGYDDGAAVTITGSNLAPGPIDLTTCLAEAGSATSAGGCDEATTVAVTVDAEGAFTLTYPVRRVVDVEGTAYDCAARAEACILFGHRPDNPLPSGTLAPLTFAAGLAPVGAAAPPEG